MGGWSSSPATGGGSIAPLSVVDANTIQQRNGTNAQVSYIYGTYTDASNYSRIKITHTGGTGGAVIATEAAGTGTAGPIRIAAGSGDIYFTTNGQLQWGLGTANNFYNGAGAWRMEQGGTQVAWLATNHQRWPSTTVSGLPAASTAGAGGRSFVTDATATTFLSVVAGGGSNGVPVVSNGTNWLIG